MLHTGSIIGIVTTVLEQSPIHRVDDRLQNFGHILLTKLKVHAHVERLRKSQRDRPVLHQPLVLLVVLHL